MNIYKYQWVSMNPYEYLWTDVDIINTLFWVCHLSRFRECFVRGSRWPKTWAHICAHLSAVQRHVSPKWPAVEMCTSPPCPHMSFVWEAWQSIKTTVPHMSAHLPQHPAHVRTCPYPFARTCHPSSRTCPRISPSICSAIVWRLIYFWSQSLHTCWYSYHI